MASSTDDYGPQLNTTIWILTGVAAVFLVLRIYCKVWRRRPVRGDDCVLVLSWFALSTSCSLLSVSTTIGYGKHNDNIAKENFNYVLLLNYLAGFFSILATCWSKISFAITLLRLASSKGIKHALWFVIVTVNLVLGANATIHFVQCWPPERLWKPESSGTCWPRSIVINYNMFAAAYSGCMDVVLASLPWLVVWKETINTKEKLSVLLAMSMGIFAGITSFLKIPTTAAIGSRDLVDSVTLLIFGTAESAITIIAVSIPILRALLYKRGNNLPRPPRFYDQQTTSQVSLTRVGGDDSAAVPQPLAAPVRQMRSTLYRQPSEAPRLEDVWPSQRYWDGVGGTQANWGGRGVQESSTLS